MRKLFIVLFVLVISFGLYAETLPVNAFIVASLDLQSDDMPSTGEVGFAKEAITDLVSYEKPGIKYNESGSPQLTLTPAENQTYAVLDATTPLYVWAKINSNDSCTVTIEATKLDGYANNTKPEQDKKVGALDWTISRDSSDTGNKDYSYDTASTPAPVAVFEHDGTIYSKFYSSHVYIKTADFAGLKHNYYEGTITVTLTADPSTESAG